MTGYDQDGSLGEACRDETKGRRIRGPDARVSRPATSATRVALVAGPFVIPEPSISLSARAALAQRVCLNLPRCLPEPRPPHVRVCLWSPRPTDPPAWPLRRTRLESQPSPALARTGRCSGQGRPSTHVEQARFGPGPGWFGWGKRPPGPHDQAAPRRRDTIGTGHSDGGHDWCASFGRGAIGTRHPAGAREVTGAWRPSAAARLDRVNDGVVPCPNGPARSCTPPESSVPRAGPTGPRRARLELHSSPARSCTPPESSVPRAGPTGPRRARLELHSSPARSCTPPESSVPRAGPTGPRRARLELHSSPATFVPGGAWGKGSPEARGASAGRAAPAAPRVSRPGMSGRGPRRILLAKIIAQSIYSTKQPRLHASFGTKFGGAGRRPEMPNPTSFDTRFYCLKKWPSLSGRGGGGGRGAGKNLPDGTHDAQDDDDNEDEQEGIEKLDP